MQFFDFSSLQVPYSDETNFNLEATASEFRVPTREPNRSYRSQSVGIGSSIQDHCQTEHASRMSQTGSDERFLHTGFPEPTAPPITHGADPDIWSTDYYRPHSQAVTVSLSVSSSYTHSSRDRSPPPSYQEVMQGGNLHLHSTLHL